MKSISPRITNLFTAMLVSWFIHPTVLSASDAIGPYISKGQSGKFSYAVYNNRWLLDPPEWEAEKDLTRVAITGISADAEGKLVIPSSIEGHDVYGIDENAFANCRNVTSIVIPKTVEFLKPGTLNRCKDLEDIIVAEDHPELASVDGVMFDKTKTRLLAVGGGRKGHFQVPESIVEIGPSAFSLCAQLKSITIPEGVTDIGGHNGNVFRGCAALEKISIPETVTNIGQVSFKACANLKEVTVPAKVTAVSHGLFWECGNLTKVTLPDGITSIGNYAFAECENLSLEVMPESLTKIGAYAFKNCKKITSISIPKNVTEIDTGAFSRDPE
jgi:hypothetical protein